MKQVNMLVVATRPQMPDVRGAALQRTLQEDLHLRVDEVRTGLASGFVGSGAFGRIRRSRNGRRRPRSDRFRGLRRIRRDAA